MRDAVREALAISTSAVALEGAWIAWSFAHSFSWQTTAIGCAVIALVMTGVELLRGARGRRERDRTERRWLRARRIPEDVPQAVWVPAVDRWRNSTWVVWSWGFIALINVSLAVTDIVSASPVDPWLLLVAVTSVAMTVYSGWLWFHLRPIIAQMEREKLQAEARTAAPAADGA